MSPRKTLLIVYHSMTDGTRQMADAARAGACSDKDGAVQVRLLHAAQAGAADVLGADGFIFATPENLAAISGQLKDFFDRSYYAVLDNARARDDLGFSPRFGLAEGVRAYVGAMDALGLAPVPSTKGSTAC